MKRCAKCKVEKELSEFSKQASASDGLRSVCKECVKEYDKQYYLEHKKEIKEYKKQWAEENKEKLSEYKKQYRENHKSEAKEYNKQWREENKDKILKQQKENYKNNREEILEQQKEYNKEHRKEINEYHKQYCEDHKKEIKEYKKQYYEDHKKEIKDYKKQYAKEHREEINEHKNQYRKERRKKDINYAIECRLRARINSALKGYCKSKSTLELLGCSIEEFKQWLESQFYDHPLTGEPMSWDNRCRWHLDHILPCASFDLTDPEQQKICMHYTNLQPLFAEQNLKKSDKLDFDLFTRPTPKCFEKIYEEI